MIIVLSVLTLFAIVAAIGAGSRVQRQMAQSQPSLRSVQEPNLSEASKLQLEPDRDSDQSTEAAPTPQSSDPLLEFERFQSDIPLAGSLSVTEAMQPSEVEPSIFQTELHEPSIARLTSHEQAAQHNGLLEEVAELAPNGHKSQIFHLAYYVNHSDPVMRSAAAFALGDLAHHCHGEDLEMLFYVLHQFSQDTNPQVRLQAATALGTLKSSDLISE